MMDDFGNALHWTTTVHGQHSLALYGYSPEYGIAVLFESIDFNDVEVSP